MKAKVTGVSAWQETPISGTLDIEVPRYVDSEGRASVSRYTGVLNAAKTGWSNSLKPSEDLWLIVQGPDDPQGVRGAFRETLVYANRTVVTEFSRVLRSSDLTGLIFDYNEPVFEPEDLNFGEVPLTMRAAAAAIEQQQADHARANTDHQQVADSLADIAQAQQGVEQSRAALEAQTAQAVQQAASVSLMQQAVASEAALAGRPAGNYPVLDTSRIVTWDGAAVTFRGPELATVATSVARVPDIASLTAYNGTALTVSVDDPLRGGTFSRALTAAAGAADDVMRIAHSNPTYVWVRRVGGVYLTSWARVPHAGGDNYAPYLQRLLDAVPRGGVIENNIRAASALAYWPVAPWARPDGKTDTILTLDRTVELRWGGNQYSGYIGYDTRTPGTVDVLQVSSTISSVPDFAGNSTEYGMRLHDLAILPTTGSPCARHALHLMPTAANNLADVFINGGQFVATNPNGRAIYSDNSGNNGMFALRIHDVKIRGGAQLIKLGDSCEIVRGLWAGHAGSPALYVSLLDPTNPTDAAAQLVIRSLNINALGGALVVEDAATTVIEGLNCEVRNRAEGGAANYGQYAVILRRCGTKGGHAGESARAYSGSRFVGNKILPADGGTYATSSGGFAVLFDDCRGWYIAGGALGTSQVLGVDNTPAANGLSITLRASNDMVVDMVDLQLTTNGIGLDIEATTKNTRIRGLSLNPIVPSSWQAVRDNGQGTMGLSKLWTPNAAYTVQAGYEPLRLLKDETGQVHLTGTLVPATGQADVPLYSTIATLPAGFAPANGEQVRRMVGIEHRGLLTAQPTYRRWAHYPARVLSAADGGQVQINSRTQEAVDDDLPITQATMISVDLNWHAPLI